MAKNDGVSRRAFVEQHRFVAGKKKPCLHCGGVFLPEYKKKAWQKKTDNERYNETLFCSKDCDDGYVRARLREVSMPRAVSKIPSWEDKVVNRA